MGVPTSPGVPASIAAETIVAQYNDLNGVRQIFSQYGADIAAIIVEPVAGNMGVVLPQPGFLEGLRQVTVEHGSLFIIDEVMTGFRVGYGGAQGCFNVEPDLTCLGKIVGGGLPAAIYGGKRIYMEQIAPSGPIYQAGTLSGNPLAMAAGLASLRLLQKGGVYENLERKTIRLAEGLKIIARKLQLPIRINSIGGMFSAFFTDQPVIDFKSACTSDGELFAAFFRGMLERGVYLAPSQYEAVFLSTAHTDEDISYTLEQAEIVLKSLS